MDISRAAVPDEFSVDGVFLIIKSEGGKVCPLEVRECCVGGT